MSNTPSQTGIRVPQAALTFVVLIFALGALLLASTNIDPKASIRAVFSQTPPPTPTTAPTPIPVDAFAAVAYVSWTSPDSLIQLEYPQSWTIQPNTQSGPFAYAITPAGNPQTGIGFFLIPTRVLNIPGVAANAAPQDLLKAAYATAPQPPTIQAVQAGDLKGAGAHLVQTQPSQTGGAATSVDTETWVLALDTQNIVVIQASSATNDWPKMQPIFMHVVNSIKIDVPNAVVALSKQYVATAAATGTATGAAVTTATDAVSTAIPTAVATTESTAIATTEPTTELTTAPTVAATAASQ